MGLALPCLLFVLAGEAFRRQGVPRLKAHRTRIGIGLVGGGILAVRAGLVPHNIKYAGFGTPLLTPLTGMLLAAGRILMFRSTVDRSLNVLARATGLGRALRRAPSPSCGPVPWWSCSTAGCSRRRCAWGSRTS